MTISLDDQINEEKIIFYEDKINEAYRELKIKKEYQSSFKNFLDILKARDIDTYLHSLRVGLKAKEIAEFVKDVDPKAMFIPGLLHDIGKIYVNPASLKKKEGFDKKDMEELKKHVMAGYNLLREIHDFSAHVLVYHHYFQKEGYPKRIPSTINEFSLGTQELIQRSGRRLSLADFYDAATHRNNNKYSLDKNKKKSLNRAKVKELLLKENPDQKHLIINLYWAGIFE